MEMEETRHSFGSTDGDTAPDAGGQQEDFSS